MKCHFHWIILKNHIGRFMSRPVLSVQSTFQLDLTHRGMCVWESDEEWRRKRNFEVSWEMLKLGHKHFIPETKRWLGEMKEKFQADTNTFDIRHNDYEYVWKCQNRSDVEKWRVTVDNDNSHGFSEASFTYSKNQTGLFHGYLSMRLPNDGLVARTGYCNVRTPAKLRSFMRKDVHNWNPFNHLLMKVRGDGRNYLLTLAFDYEFDVMWGSQHHYRLFTRGGPYWQIAKIPFSKFYEAYKSRIQDRQSKMNANDITFLGFTLADNIEGPFCLEIDSIAVMLDENHTEECAYESYQVEPYIV